MERKTPLYQTHVDAGGKIVEFGGFLMPVQYPTGVLAEHMAVRQKAGLFDVSHMGELRLKGPAAVANVQKLSGKRTGLGRRSEKCGLAARRRCNLQDAICCVRETLRS